MYFLLADIFDVCVPQQVERIVIIIIAISFLLGSVIGRYRIKLYGLYGWKTLAKYINTQAVNDRIDELSQINKDN